MAEEDYTEPLITYSNELNQENDLLGSVGFFIEPEISSDFVFPDLVAPANSNNYIAIDQETFNETGPISFSDLGRFIAEAKGLPVENYGLNNLFLEAEQYSITLSNEANFLKPHKTSEFYGASRQGISIEHGPYDGGLYHIWAETLKSEGGYGYDAIIESNPVADGAVRILSDTIMPTNAPTDGPHAGKWSAGDDVQEDSKFVAFKLKTDAPAGKWIKYRIKCFDIFQDLQNAAMQTCWPLFDYDKSVADMIYVEGRGTSARSNLLPLASMSKTYAALTLPNDNTNRYITFGYYEGAFSYALNLLGQSAGGGAVTYICADPYQADDFLWSGNRIYLFRLVKELFYVLDGDELHLNDVNKWMNIFYTNYSGGISLGTRDYVSPMYIAYELISKGSYTNGNNHYGNTTNNIIARDYNTNSMGKYKVYKNDSPNYPNQAYLNVLSDERFDHSMEINSNSHLYADISNLHTILEIGYYDAAENNQIHTNLLFAHNHNYWYQEGLAYIQPGSNGINEAIAYVYFPKGRYQEGNILIEPESITDYALTKVEDIPDAYGIVKGQELLNLEHLQPIAGTNEQLTNPNPSAAEKNTAKIIWENFYQNMQPYWYNAINHDLIHYPYNFSPEDPYINTVEKTNSNWVHLRTAHFVNVGGQIKQDLFSQHQHDVFSAYYDKITLKSSPKPPTRDNYKLLSEYDSGHKDLPSIISEQDVNEVDILGLGPTQDFACFTYEYDIPLKFKNYLEDVAKFIGNSWNLIYKNQFPLFHIHVKKIDEQEADDALMSTVLSQIYQKENWEISESRPSCILSVNDDFLNWIDLALTCPFDLNVSESVGVYFKPGWKALKNISTEEIILVEFPDDFLIGDYNYVGEGGIDQVKLFQQNWNPGVVENERWFNQQFNHGRTGRWRIKLVDSFGEVQTYQLVSYIAEDETNFLQFLIYNSLDENNKTQLRDGKYEVTLARSTWPYYSDPNENGLTSIRPSRPSIHENSLSMSSNKFDLYINERLINEVENSQTVGSFSVDGKTKYNQFNNFGMVALHEIQHMLGFIGGVSLYGWDLFKPFRYITEAGINVAAFMVSGSTNNLIKHFSFANFMFYKSVYSGGTLCFLNVNNDLYHYSSIFPRDCTADSGEYIVMPNCTKSGNTYVINHNYARPLTKYNFHQTILDLYLYDKADSNTIIQSVTNNTENTQTTITVQSGASLPMICVSPSYAIIYHWIYISKHLKNENIEDIIWTGFNNQSGSDYSVTIPGIERFNACFWTGIHFEINGNYGSHIEEESTAFLGSGEYVSSYFTYWEEEYIKQQYFAYVEDQNLTGVQYLQDSSGNYSGDFELSKNSSSQTGYVVFEIKNIKSRDYFNFQIDIQANQSYAWSEGDPVNKIQINADTSESEDLIIGEQGTTSLQSLNFKTAGKTLVYLYTNFNGTLTYNISLRIVYDTGDITMITKNSQDDNGLQFRELMTFQPIRKTTSNPLESPQDWVYRPDIWSSRYLNNNIPVMIAPTYPYELLSISETWNNPNDNNDYSWITMGMSMDIGWPVRSVTPEQFAAGDFFGEKIDEYFNSRAHIDRWSDGTNYDSIINFPNLNTDQLKYFNWDVHFDYNLAPPNFTNSEDLQILSLDGQDDRIEVPHAEYLNSSFTMSIIERSPLQGFSNNPILVSKGDALSNGWELFMQTENQVSHICFRAGNNILISNQAVGQADGTFDLTVLVVDQNEITTNITIYRGLDVINLGSIQTSTSLINQEDLWIGGSSTRSDQFYNSDVYNVAFWDHALSEEDLPIALDVDGDFIPNYNEGDPFATIHYYETSRARYSNSGVGDILPDISNVAAQKNHASIVCGTLGNITPQYSTI